MEREDALENFRRQIDNIDNEILILLKRRIQLVKKVAKYKLANDIKIENLSREDEIIQNLKLKTIAMGLSEGFTRNLFQLIIKESKICQRDFIEKEQARIERNKTKK